MKSDKVISSLFWKFLERFGTVGIQFIIQLFLARLLSPSDYGTIALITVFITISNVFVQNGFNTALIQQKDVIEEDYSSVFWVSIGIAAICYFILFLVSPYIAEFYGVLELKVILRILGLTLFFGAYNSIQIAKVSRTFQFKALFYSSLLSALISGIVGIIMAKNGFGVWALVTQQLFNQIIVSAVLYFKVKWKLLFILEKERIKKLFGFGSRLLVSSLIDVIYNNLYSLVIGKFFNSTLLGYYNRADQFPNLIVYNVNGSIQSVILPALSEKQDKIDEVKSLVRRAMSLSSYVIFPMMIGMAACAEPMVILLLTDKWLTSVPFIQMLCFSYMLWPIHTANLQAINALGRSDIFLKLEVIKKVVGITTLIISVPFGIFAMVLMKLLTGIISSFINAYPNKKLLNYGYKQQVIDILPTLIISMLMGISVIAVDVFVSAFTNIVVFRLIIDFTLGIFVYLILSMITKNQNLIYIFNYLKMKRGK